MTEEILRDGKSWGIEEAVEEMELEVKQAKWAMEAHKSELNMLTDRYMSLSIGLKILQRVNEEYQSSKESPSSNQSTTQENEK